MFIYLPIGKAPDFTCLCYLTSHTHIYIKKVVLDLDTLTLKPALGRFICYLVQARNSDWNS